MKKNAMKKFIISTPVGDGLVSDPVDVRKVRIRLIKLGFDDPNPEFGHIDRTLDRNIRAFQVSHNLKAAGLIFPGGKTELAMKKAMARTPIFRCPKCGAPHGGSHPLN